MPTDFGMQQPHIHHCDSLAEVSSLFSVLVQHYLCVLGHSPSLECHGIPVRRLSSFNLGVSVSSGLVLCIILCIMWVLLLELVSPCVAEPKHQPWLSSQFCSCKSLYPVKYVEFKNVFLYFSVYIFCLFTKFVSV